MVAENLIIIHQEGENAPTSAKLRFSESQIGFRVCKASHNTTAALAGKERETSVLRLGVVSRTLSDSLAKAWSFFRRHFSVLEGLTAGLKISTIWWDHEVKRPKTRLSGRSHTCG